MSGIGACFFPIVQKNVYFLHACVAAEIFPRAFPLSANINLRETPVLLLIFQIPVTFYSECNNISSLIRKFLYCCFLVCGTLSIKLH